MEVFEQAIQGCIAALQSGKLIVFPTETGWCLGADATDDAASEQLLHLKPENSDAPPIVLLADEREVLRWVATADLAVFDFLAAQEKPTAMVFAHPLGLAAAAAISNDSVAIRLVNDAFCRHLVKRLRKPILSLPLPDACNIGQVGYIAAWDREAPPQQLPAQLVRWVNGAPFWISR